MKIRLLLFVMLICVAAHAFGGCVTLQSGLLKYSATSFLAGEPIPVGFNAYGYNYQAHMFLGSYFNAYANSDGFPAYLGDDDAYLAATPDAAHHWAWPHRSVTVEMKWNEAWLSNKDCDADGLLDRHFGFKAYAGSGAWLTNHQSDITDGVHWTDFVKIVALPADAILQGGIWYTADGSTEYGPDPVWGDKFATIQEVYNDPAVAAHGVLSKSAVNPGFGFYKP
jgi:hypothetical protein